METNICTIGTFHNARDVELAQSGGTQKKMLSRNGTRGPTTAEYIDCTSCGAKMDEVSE